MSQQPQQNATPTTNPTSPPLNNNSTTANRPFVYGQPAATMQPHHTYTSAGTAAASSGGGVMTGGVPLPTTPTTIPTTPTTPGTVTSGVGGVQPAVNKSGTGLVQPTSPTISAIPQPSIDQTIDSLFRNKNFSSPTGSLVGVGVNSTLSTSALNPSTPPTTAKTTEEKAREKKEKDKERREREQREREQKEREQRDREQREALLAAAREPETEILGKKKLHELLQQVSPVEKMDEEVEDMLAVLADDFVESVVSFACTLAKHRNSTTLEVKDLQCHLERNWNIRVPGFGTDQVKTFKKQNVPDNHKTRLALMKKNILAQNKKLNQQREQQLQQQQQQREQQLQQAAIQPSSSSTSTTNNNNNN
ncbi:hypothetical protein DFA_06565 [Cavenderia fasciculata]|uniref:Transcription initiation factor TFIID subunit 12 domain-containing protein n=1 Tax=Cavenderia fasciculata TaxID=261658 RepID=F4PJC9_CACFS|nr:uncharacterized protein DFA_06565 [Cavenderia fasciculata]EGG24415.1 hypothetical protein DFA_06565 [Cavenderia fasciculata]|eukprot:XP_004362266.1 hypothetical protein DFA_06565 [Cavenderia fasciculata]